MGSSSSGSGAATSAATRRKSQEGIGGNTKKSKQEVSHKASPTKVRNREKIGDELAKHSDDFVYFKLT
jgi:hypothetical protein